MGTVTREWGFRLLKLDFLFAACMVPHDGLNRGQLMADALGLLRESVPEGVAFDLCGVPLASALGRTEYCRIGCDVGLDWDDVPYMRLLHRERVSTKRSLANTRGRAHLDGRAFRNDPDVFFLRDDVKLTKKPASRPDRCRCRAGRDVPHLGRRGGLGRHAAAGLRPCARGVRGQGAGRAGGEA